jgi:hypothetical protein
VDIDLTDGNGKHRAEDVQPGGFVPSHLAAPALRGSAATILEYAATEIGGMVLAADLIGHGESIAGDRAAARTIGESGRQVQRLLRALAAGALVALVAVGLSVGGARPAAAATVPASVPAIEAPQPDPAPVRDRTAFGKGTWLDLGCGNLAVSAPLREFVPSVGWLPSPWTTVQVQEYSVKRGRWVLRKTLTTNSRGVAAGTLHLGGGWHTVRVVHPGSPWTLPTTGSTRRVDVSDEALDII